jgi:protein TonB
MQPAAKPEQKTYRKGSGLYFSTGLVFCMVLIVTAFEWKTPYKILKDEIPKFEKKDIEEPIFKTVLIPDKPKPKIERTGGEIKIVPEVEASKEIDKAPPIIDEDIPVDENAILGSLLGPGAPADDEPGEAIMVSKVAVPANGYDAFYNYIFKSLRVPDHLLSRNRDGKVYVSFVVDTDGSLSDIQIEKGFDQQLEKQIIQLLKDAPAWEPAIQQGRKVRTRMQLPITIKIAH